MLLLGAIISFFHIRSVASICLYNISDSRPYSHNKGNYCNKGSLYNPSIVFGDNKKNNCRSCSYSISFISNNFENRCNLQLIRASHSRISSFNNATKNKPPDLSSLLLSERIVFIGLPIHPTVGQLIISQLLYLDYDSQDKPIKIYINSGDGDADELNTSEIDALNIVDVINYIKNDVITINLGKAYGPSAIILASGRPGKRFVLPRSCTSLRQSSVTLPFRQAEDIAIYSNEILRARKNIINVLSKICNKSEEDVLEKLKNGEYMDAQETINYGLADKIIEDVIS